jgi:predicted metal-dependent hydrolase
MAIQVRNPPIRLEGVPRHWFGGSPVATHLANGVGILFPAGERFFVRSVRHYMDRLDDDPKLKEDVRLFFGQEGRHANAHDRHIELLEAQGYGVRKFLALYERFAYRVIEPLAPPALRLAATVACEHFTAIMAENALARGLLESAHPTMRELYEWHAAEELEHKAVAFDVLAKVAPGFGLRMAGLAFATVLLAGFWIAAAATLLAQDKRAGRVSGNLLRELRRFGAEHPIHKRVFGRGLVEFARRGFHPLDNDTAHLAEAYFNA